MHFQIKNTNNISRAFLGAALLAFATSAHSADYGTYKGKGGMGAYKITPNVYDYHYDKGFVGADAMGWSPNLQFAWSRIGAAQTCGMPVSMVVVVPKLIEQYQQDKLTHEMIGIGFHAAQSKANPNFCSEERVAELKELIPAFEKGDFPRKF